VSEFAAIIAHVGGLMRFIFRVLAASVVLVFYLPAISGVMLAIADATGGVPGTLTG